MAAVFSRGNLVLGKLRPTARLFSADAFLQGENNPSSYICHGGFSRAPEDFTVDSSRQKLQPGSSTRSMPKENPSSGRCRGGFSRAPEDVKVDSPRQKLQPGSCTRSDGAASNLGVLYARYFGQGDESSGVDIRPMEEFSGLEFRPMEDLYRSRIRPGCFPTVTIRPAVSLSVLRRKDFKEWEDEAGLHIRLDMPGLGLENVKVQMEDGTLAIRGEPGEESEYYKERKLVEYKCLVDVPANVYKTEEIKFEMNHGVLKVVVPKITAEERSSSSTN